ncbi:MAG: type II toxin-antitoxin system VapC family toxin [Actinomycetota bacterium]
MIVVDASVLVNAIADDGPDGDRSRARLGEASSLHAPHLVDLEVLSVLRRRAASLDLDARRLVFCLEDLGDLPITRYPHLPFAERIWNLRHNLTPYDAAYVALAETLECVMVTADASLSRAAGPTCTIELVRSPR